MKAWPAKIFANRRIPKLKGRMVYEIVSITNNMGIKRGETFFGITICMKDELKKKKPKNVILKQIKKLKQKVKEIKLVLVT
jgi:hypothetical protein